MVRFDALIEKFGIQGEKTGWCYVVIPASIAAEIKPGNKKTFRVKGKMDKHPVNMVALLPRGNGDFILPVNAAMRKATGKSKGATITLQLQEDHDSLSVPPGFIECLQDEPNAFAYYESLPPSHKNYFIKWISEAKTENTKANRIAVSINGLARQMNYGEILREMKKIKQNY